MKSVLNNENHSYVGTLHIACTIDESFSFPLTVLLISLFETNKEQNIKIHLFSASLSAEIIQEFNELVESYKQQFAFYEIRDIHQIKDLPINQRISIAAYYRILIPQIICPSVDKYLYLDADIIINDDITEIFKINLGDNIFGAVNDIVGIEKKYHTKHNIPEKYLYFNSGVLIVNKNLWLKKNATDRTFEYLNKNKNICKYHDQDGLNGALYMERSSLPPIWNQLIDIYYIPKKIILKSYGLMEVKNALNKPKIIHFNGPEKPWEVNFGHPHLSKFNYYAKKAKKFEGIQKRNPKKKALIYALFGWKNINKFYYYKSVFDNPEKHIEPIL